MKAPVVSIVLGGTVWSRASAGWTPAEVAETELACVCADPAGRTEWLLVYEPEGMAHERIPGYYRSRAEFSESLRNRERFPVIERADGAWAIDSLNFDSAIPAETFFHSELKPCLRTLWDECDRNGVALVGAWSLFSVLASLRARRPRAEPACAVLVAAGDYVAVAFCDGEGGPGLFRRWVGEPSEQTWRAVAVCLRELKVAVELPPGGPGRKGARGLRVYSEGKVVESSPRWAEWRQSSDSVRFAGFDALADELLRSRRSTAPNLVRSFPRPLDGSRVMRVVGVLALAIIVGATASSVDSWRRIRAERARMVRVQEEQSELERALRANRELIEQLAARPAVSGDAVLTAIDRLAEALPASASIGLLHFAPSGAIELAGPFVGPAPGVGRVGEMLRVAGILPARVEVSLPARQWQAEGQILSDSHAN